MKRTQIYRTLCILFSGLLLFPLQAQFDDLYYNPETDYIAEATRTNEYNNYSQSAESDYEYTEQQDDYDAEPYDHFNEYDFYYSSRIRRFHRPTSFGFYDPYYVDCHYYDPFFSPGLTIYIGSGWNSYRYNPWRNHYWPHTHWNRWGGYNYYDPWYSPYRSYWGYNPYYGGNNIFVNNYYYGDGWGYNDPWRYDSDNQFTRIYNRDNLNNRGTYYGPRTTGSTRGTRESRNAGLRNGNSDNYDRYPNSRRAPRTSEGDPDQNTNRVVNPRRNEQGLTPGRSDAGNGVERPKTGRERKEMNTPFTDFENDNSTSAPQERNSIRPSEQNDRRKGVERTKRERRSIFSPRSSSKRNKSYNPSRSNRSPSTTPNNSNSRSRNKTYNRPSRSRSNSSGINSSSNSNRSSSGINRSNNSSSRSSGSSGSRTNSRRRG